MDSELIAFSYEVDHTHVDARSQSLTNMGKN